VINITIPNTSPSPAGVQIATIYPKILGIIQELNKMNTILFEEKESIFETNYGIYFQEN
jgi:hypothetical protein